MKGDLLVLLAIADHADHCGRAHPGMALIARKARLSLRQAQRAIRHLHDLGELRVDPNAGPHGTNVYRVTLCQGRQNVRGDISSRRGVTPMSSKPSEETVRRKKKTSGDILSQVKRTNGVEAHPNIRKPIPV
jgi:hypothetical protein